MDNEEQPQPGSSSLRLPPFWAENTEAWFAIAEARFRLRNVVDEQVMFDLVVNSLQKESLRPVLDLVTEPPEEHPYTRLKDRLCVSHQLTDFQRVEKLHQLDSLGGRKPSELLHEMTEMCPTGYEESPFFIYLYLERLPRELRIVLGDLDDNQDLRALAVRADRLWSLHNHKQPSLLASVDVPAAQPSATIAAVGFNKAAKHRSGGQQKNRRGGGRNGGHGGQSGSSGAAGGSGAAGASGSGSSAGPSPDSLARQSAGLCYHHWRYGDGAFRCGGGGCSWQGN